jgi:hypothetical protein
MGNWDNWFLNRLIYSYRKNGIKFAIILAGLQVPGHLTILLNFDRSVKTHILGLMVTA